MFGEKRMREVIGSTGMRDISCYSILLKTDGRSFMNLRTGQSFPNTTPSIRIIRSRS